MSIQLILLDLDGTLLTSDKQLTPASRTALEKAAAAGIHIVPSTGRIFDAIPDLIRDLPFIRYFVTSNGAQIYDRETDTVLYRGEISPQDAEAVYDRLEQLPLIFDCYCDDRAFMPADHYARVEEFIPDPHLRKLVTDLRQPLPDFRAAMRGKSAQKIQAFFPTREQRIETARDLMWDFPHMSLTNSYPFNLEINSRAASKGEALRFLCSHLDIPIRDSMAFGDGSNDLSMIQAAGFGIAMENAEEALKVSAKYVTASNDEDGVAKAMEHFCIHPLDSEPPYEDPEEEKRNASALTKLKNFFSGEEN